MVSTARRLERFALATAESAGRAMLMLCVAIVVWLKEDLNRMTGKAGQHVPGIIHPRHETRVVTDIDQPDQNELANSRSLQVE